MIPLTTLQIGMTAAARQAGGLDRYYFNLVKSLPFADVGTCGVVAGDPSRSADPSAGIEGIAPEGASMFRRWHGIRKATDRLIPKCSAVASHFAPYAFPILDRLGHRPLVVHFHGPWKLESRDLGANALNVIAKGALERIVYARAARFIVLSRASGEMLAREYAVPWSRIRVVPGGVDLEHFQVTDSRENVRRRLGWPLDRPIVVSVRRLIRGKGLEHLVAAAAQLRSVIDNVLIVIAGTGPLREELDRRVRECRLERNVWLVGHVVDELLPLYYRAANVSIVPSNTAALELFGLIALESLACGTPVLVTPVGGLPEVVADLDPALVLPGSTPKDLSDGLRAVLERRVVVPGEEDCVRYASGFSWPAIAARIADIYRDTTRTG